MKTLTAPLRLLLAAVLTASVFASGGNAAAQQRTQDAGSQSLAEFLRRAAADPSRDPRSLIRIAEAVSQVARELRGQDEAQMEALARQRLEAEQAEDFMEVFPIMVQIVKLIWVICGEGVANMDRCMAMIQARCAEPPSQSLACLEAWAAGRSRGGGHGDGWVGRSGSFHFKTSTISGSSGPPGRLHRGLNTFTSSNPGSRLLTSGLW